jgi:hypothetical protein
LRALPFGASVAGMLKTLQTLIDKLASHATLWPLLGGSIMTALAGWATYATELFRAYAPFSWYAQLFWAS